MASSEAGAKIRKPEWADSQRSCVAVGIGSHPRHHVKKDPGG